MNHRMAVCDHEEQYLYHLTEYLEKKEVFPFTIHGFTSLHTLQTYAECNEISFLLISEALWEEEILSWYQGNLLILNETGERKEKEDLQINKYQSIEVIYQKIMSVCMDMGIRLPSVSGSGKQIRVIGCYTPIHRCLQTSFSICLGQILARKSKVLYINLESYSGFSYLMKEQSQGDLTDILYFLSCDKDKLAYKFSTMMEEWKGMDYIAPFIKGMGVQEISGEEWMELISFVCKNTEYKYLILDLGEQTKQLLEILSVCDWIVTIIRQDSYARAKLKQYEDLLKMTQYENILLKTTKLELPYFRQLSGDIHQLPYGELSSYIKHLITEDGLWKEVIREEGQA